MALTPKEEEIAKATAESIGQTANTNIVLWGSLLFCLKQNGTLSPADTDGFFNLVNAFAAHISFDQGELDETAQQRQREIIAITVQQIHAIVESLDRAEQKRR